ncbi:MAG: tail sheath protein [Frankiales bacterium]|nr:tail sheath protein [Frankiales bacterium]
MPQYLSPGVFVEELPPAARPIEGVSTSIAAFVGLAATGPFDTPVLVTNWTQFCKTFGEFVEGSYLAHAVYGFFTNGGSTCYVVRVGAAAAKAEPAALPAAAAELTGTDKTPAYAVRALEAGDAGSTLSVDVNPTPAAEGGDETYTVVVRRGGEPVETFEGLTTKRGKTNVVTTVNAQSKLIKIEEVAKTGTIEKLAPGSTPLATPASALIPAQAAVGPDDYVGSAADRTGFGVLETLEDITMVAVPDLVAALQKGAIDLEGFKAVQLGIINHCELMGDRMAILDPPPGLGAQQIKDWRTDVAGYDSKYAALYWPQVKVFDPLSGRNIFVPPSGHLAGMWSRSDAERGVHKAPANEVLRGVVDVEASLTRGEHDQLNPIGVNVIKSFPGRGIRVWGARTLSSDPGWRYINVRRLFSFVEDSLLGSMDWVVFEPNDRDLWARISREVNAFLYRLWQSGALFGSSPDEAYYVRCTHETNPSEHIEAGLVTTEIGLAAVKPAEFVVFRLASLPTGTASVSE